MTDTIIAEQPVPNMAFITPGLERADHIRADPARLADLRAHSDARLLLLDGLAPEVTEEALVWTSLDVTDDAELVFLGLEDGAARFAQVPATGDNRPAFQQRASRTALAVLSARDISIYGAARSLVDWHARHRFCANCAAPTTLGKGGWQRGCSACEAQHFPRVDPVAIMLVEHENEVLLGRGVGFPTGLYSALAGFVEPGETIEQGVAREVLEEVGLVVRDVQYVASQPWPFPAQLMIGCHAMADTHDLVIDETEIADARWYSREVIIEARRTGEGPDGFKPPLSFAIASHLIDWWLERGE